MLQGIEIIFEDRDKMMAHLKKKTYKEYTENFIQNHGHYFEEMTTYVEGAKDKEAAAKEIGECLASAVKKTFVNKKGKIGARTLHGTPKAALPRHFPCLRSVLPVPANTVLWELFSLSLAFSQSTLNPVTSA